MKPFHLTFGTFFGIGRMPWMPGTFGSAVALAVAAGLSLLPHPIFFYFGFLLLVFFLGVWSSGVCADAIGSRDPREVVVDEAAGIFVTFAGISITPLAAILGFAFFRLFDIWKPYPIKRLESLAGGWGIMMDDVAAGIYANLLLRICLGFF